MKLRHLLLAVLAAIILAMLMFGCSWYVPYPSVGVGSSTKSVNVSTVKCCFMVTDIDLNWRKYHCEQMTVQQCQSLKNSR